MATGYEGAYDQLAAAAEALGLLDGDAPGPAREACLRVALGHVARAASLAARCLEVSTPAEARAQGGPYTAARDELARFIAAPDQAPRLAALPPEETREAVGRWVEDARGLVERARRAEARATNLQYARIPEEQDYGLVPRDGRAWERALPRR